MDLQKTIMRCGASISILLHQRHELVPVEQRDSNFPFMVDIDPSSFAFVVDSEGVIASTLIGALQAGTVKVHLFLDAENVKHFRYDESFAAVPFKGHGQHNFFEIVVDLSNLEIEADGMVSTEDWEKIIFRHVVPK